MGGGHVSLWFSTGKTVCCWRAGVHQRFFGPKCDPNMQVRCIVYKLMNYSGLQSKFTGEEENQLRGHLDNGRKLRRFGQKG